MQEQDETKPEQKYAIDEWVTPKRGSFKGKAGKIIKIVWGTSSKEWMYSVRFTRVSHWYYVEEIEPVLH